MGTKVIINSHKLVNQCGFTLSGSTSFIHDEYSHIIEFAHVVVIIIKVRLDFACVLVLMEFMCAHNIIVYLA